MAAGEGSGVSMSHVFTMMVGVIITVGALKINATETAWGLLFLLALAISFLGWAMQNDEQNRR